jgi:gliding motility-associated lipoprotein GldH
MVLSMTYGLDFDYQNIYVKIETHYPSGELTEDILSLNLTDGMGIFLGDCNSSKCEIDILLQEKFKFKEKGEYTITIIQNGREENLEEIYGAELQLFKNKETTQ